MSSTTTPGNSFLPSHARDPALDPANEYTHPHHDHAVEPLNEVKYTTAHHPREQPSEFDPTPVSYSGEQTHQKGPYSSEEEKAYELGSANSPTGEGEQHIKTRGWYSGFKLYWHILFLVLITAWWVASVILHRPGQTEHEVYNWVVPFLLWLALSLRLITYHVSPRPVFRIIKLVWRSVFVATLDKTVPKAYRGYAGAALTVAVFLIGSMASRETASNNRADRAISLFGLAVFIAVFWATSADRKRINWKTVQVGLIAQFLIAFWVLRSGFGYGKEHASVRL